MCVNETVLVTGGAGFIGSHLAKHLIDKGFTVVVLDDLSGGFVENIPPKAHFVQGCITNNTLVTQLFEKYTFTYVYHLAAYAAEGLSHFIRRFNYTNNVLGSVNLINAAIKYQIKCFVFASSIAVYGTNVLPMVETATPNPEDPYGIAKYAIELDLKAANELFGLNYIVFRPHNVFGEGQNIGDKYRNVIGIFMNQLLQNKPLTVYGNGQQTRAFSYIDEVAPYMADAVTIKDAYNQVFNIGNDKQYSLNELAVEVMAVMDKKMPIHYLEARKEVQHAYANHDKMKKVFQMPNQNTTITDGLLKMSQWVKVHGARKTKKFNAIEIEQGLPENWKNI